MVWRWSSIWRNPQRFCWTLSGLIVTNAPFEVRKYLSLSESIVSEIFVFKPGFLHLTVRLEGAYGRRHKWRNQMIRAISGTLNLSMRHINKNPLVQGVAPQCEEDDGPWCSRSSRPEPRPA